MNKTAILSISAFTLLATLLIWISPQFYYPDDSYFYFQVARNILSGSGSTFNGLMPTNGYHPLWMAIVCVAGWISGTDPFAFLRGILVCQMLILATSVLLFNRISRQFTTIYRFPSIALLIVFFFTFNVIGTEAVINFLSILILLWFIIKNDKLNNLQQLMLGLIFGLVFLARTDNIFVIIVTCLLILQKYWTRGFRYILTLFTRIILSFLIITVPYLVYNYFEFSSMIPISGAIKSTFPMITLNLNYSLKKSLFVIILNLLSLLWSYKYETSDKKKMLLNITSYSSILQMLYVLLFTNNLTAWNWYYIIAAVNIAFCISFILDYFNNKIKTVHSISLIFTLFAVVCGTFNVVSQFQNSNFKGRLPIQLNSKRECLWQIDAASGLSSKLSLDSAILMTDYPGIFAFFSDYKVIPSDGLMSNYVYQRELAEYGFDSIKKKYSIAYLIAPYYELPRPELGYTNAQKDDGTFEFTFYSVLYKKVAGTTLLYNEQLMSKFREDFPCDTSNDFALWHLNIFHRQQQVY